MVLMLSVMLDVLPLLFFAGLATLALVWLLLHRRVLALLKRDHAAAFPATHGRRPPLEQGMMLQFFFLGGFLFQKGYTSLGDKRITLLSRVLKLMIPLIVLCFLGMMLSPMFIEVTRR